MGRDVAGPQRSRKAGLPAQDGRAMDGHRARRERRPAHRHAMPAPSIRNADVGPRRRADPAQCLQRHLRSLINCYQTDADSPYQKNRFTSARTATACCGASTSGTATKAVRHQGPRPAGLAQGLERTARSWRPDRPSSASFAPYSVSARPYLKIPTASGYVASCTRCAFQGTKPAASASRPNMPT
jgi:hypothetical protein